jgi:hypothetical protein
VPSFTDNAGQRWPYEVDFASLRRVERLLGVDLIALPEATLFRRLASPIFLIDVLYCLCKPEADQQGLTDEQFGERCVTDLQPVLDSLVGGLADFFRRLGRPQQSRTMTETWTMSREILNLTSDQSGRVLERMGEALREAIDSQESGEPSTETPPSQESATYTAVG